MVGACMRLCPHADKSTCNGPLVNIMSDTDCGPYMSTGFSTWPSPLLTRHGFDSMRHYRESSNMCDCELQKEVPQQMPWPSQLPAPSLAVVTRPLSLPRPFSGPSSCSTAPMACKPPLLVCNLSIAYTRLPAVRGCCSSGVDALRGGCSDARLAGGFNPPQSLWVSCMCVLCSSALSLRSRACLCS